MEILLKSVLLISLFWGFYKLFLEKSTFFQSNRAYFIGGIVLAFVLPFVLIPVEVIVPVDTSLLSGEVVNPAVKEVNSFWGSLTPGTVLGVLYLLGVGVMLGRLAVQVWSLKRFLNKLPKIKIGKIFLRETTQSVTAFSFFKNIVVNAENFDPDELTQIIDHETVHIHQWHSIDMLITQILVIVQWFNPLAWNYKKLTEQNLEFIADRQAVGKSSGSDSYTRLLLKTSVENYPFVLTNSFNHSLIKNRIHMLHTPQTLNVHKWKLVLILPVLALFMYAFNRVEKPVYQANESHFTTIYAENPVDFTATITKESTDADLDAIKQILASQEVEFDLKKLKRNAKNEIIAIDLELKGKNVNAVFNSEDSDGIQPVLIQYNAKDQKIKIGNFNYVFDKQSPQKKHVKVVKNDDSEEENVIFISSSGDETKMKTIKVIASDTMAISGKAMQWTVEDEGDEGTGLKKYTIVVKGDTEYIVNGKVANKKEVEELKKYTIVLEGDEEGITKYIINGKEVSKEELEELKPDEIKEVQVIKKKKSDK